MAKLVVSAGEHARENCPVWTQVDPSLVADGPLVLKDDDGNAIPCQVAAGEADAASVCFILDQLGKGDTKEFSLEPGACGCAGVELTDVPGEKVEVKIAGQLFTDYNYSPEYARPFCLPIVGPYGDTITRHYPIDEVEGEAQDHHHHKSFWVAWGEINGADHWSESGRHSKQVHQEFESLQSGPVFGRIVALNHWLDVNEKKLLEELRTLTFYNVPQEGRLVDMTVEFRATEGALFFGDTKEGGICSIRVATSMDAKQDGTIVNAYGGINEAETWGKRSPWCDYFGPVKGKTVGVTIFDSPTNFRYPTYWHVRNYGLMTANPFGLSHFHADKARDGSHRVGHHEVFPFAYRVYFHAGDTWQGKVAEKFLDHMAPPQVEVA